MSETGYFPKKSAKIRSLCFERKAQVSFRRSYFPPQIQGENTNYKIRVATSGHSITTLGLDRTGHMSFLTGQDRTPKFAGQVLPDRTESGLIFLNI